MGVRNGIDADTPGATALYLGQAPQSTARWHIGFGPAQGEANLRPNCYPNTWTTTVSQNAVVTTAQAVAMVIWFDANAWPVLNCVAIK